MKILPISNNEISYKAKLPKTEVKTLIQMAKLKESGDGIPKLYTLLDLLDKSSGKVAQFTTKTKISKFRAMGQNGAHYPSSTYNTLYIDNVEIKKGTGTKLDILQRAMTDYQTKDGKFIQMPQSVFDRIWWENRDKSIKDIEKFVLQI